MGIYARGGFARKVSKPNPSSQQLGKIRALHLIGAAIGKHMRIKVNHFLVINLLCLQLVVPGAVSGQNQNSLADIDTKVNLLIQRMTIEEKIDLLGGTDGFYARGIPRLGIARLT